MRFSWKIKVPELLKVVTDSRHRHSQTSPAVKSPPSLTHSIYAAVAALMLSGCGCGGDFDTVATDRAQLVDGFESYMSQAELMVRLAERTDVTIIPDPKVHLPTDSRPPFNIVVVELASFEHLKHQGNLRITLFNNRLQHVRFFPEDPKGYFMLFRQSETTLWKHLERVFGNVVLRQATDYRGRDYVAWEDKRLIEESNRWILCYA
jgi:hypothetical protein